MADSTVAYFTEVTGSTPEVATQYLQLSDDNLETAMQLYFENGGDALQAPPTTETQPTSASRSTDQSRTRTGGRSGYEDEQGVVHIDSDNEESSAEDVPVVTGERSRISPPSNQLPSTASPTFNDDLAMAQRLQEELFSGGDNPETAGVRAPMERRTETLVGPGADQGYDPMGDMGMDPQMLQRLRARAQQRSGRPGIFNQREVASSSIWNEDDDESAHTHNLARATGGASEASSKASMLAEMYRPPFEIMTRVSWDTARDEGRENMKWLLVNIQDSSVFDCQLLNRDLWKNEGVVETVKEHFIFLQYAKEDPRGAQYIQYYFPGYDVQDNYPHIAIVDPRTGEQMKTWTGPPIVKAPDFLMQLHEFLDRYSLNNNVRNPIAKRKPEVKPHAKIDTMSEEEMLEMAMKNSLEGQSGAKHEDPDELTRSFGDIKGKGKATENGDVEMKDESTPNGQEEEEEEQDNPFFKIPSDKPHTEPNPDPATTTRIQFRHSSGRVIRRFALSDTVQRLYEWLKSSPLEGKEGVEFELVAMGQNLIGLLDSTVEEAGLKNGTVMVGFIED